jgi:sigma-B regulation protein RsbU (phosphoserine phosphatase)
VAEIRDWIALGKNTISSLKTSDVTRLYKQEWPETREMLIAEHRASIDGEKYRLRRMFRYRSAILYGLAKRLAPHRRVIFLIAFVWFFLCLFVVTTSNRGTLDIWPLIEMGGAFVLMVLLLAMELADKIKIRDELELARDLQAGLIPKVMPLTEEYEIAAFNRIANTVGGDIYDFVPLDDRRLAVLFGDASGHGMAAGLVMAVAHAAFRTQLDMDPSPSAIIGSLNRILCRTGGNRSFFASCYVLFERDGRFSATVAGHPQIVKIGADGKIAARLGQGSYPLGVKTNMEWESIDGRLAPGERLLFNSDGLTEARNAQEREFGDAFVDAIIGWSPSASPAALVDTIVAEWNLFTGGRAPEDDVSVAVIQHRTV